MVRNLKSIVFLFVAWFCFLSTHSLRAQNKPIAQLIEIYNNPQNYPNYVMVAAHRGYWKDRPENSLSAIEAAINLGVDMVELDLRKTKDNVLVVAHDRWLGRITTNNIASDRPIDKMNYDKFKKQLLVLQVTAFYIISLTTFNQHIGRSCNTLYIVS